MGGMGNKELFYYFLGVLDTSKLDLNNGFLFFQTKEEGHIVIVHWGSQYISSIHFMGHSSCIEHFLASSCGVVRVVGSYQLSSH